MVPVSVLPFLPFFEVGLHAVAGAAVGYSLVRVCQWIGRQSALLGAIVMTGILLQAASGLLMFWISYLNLPVLSGLHSGDGFWRMAPDAEFYTTRAALAVDEGLATIDSTEASPAFLRLLTIWMQVVGISPISGMFLNLTLYGLLCALVVRVWKPAGDWRRDMPSALLLASVSFSPMLVFNGTQALKDNIYLFLLAGACVGAWLVLRAVIQGLRKGISFSDVLVGQGLLLLSLYAMAGIRAYYAFMVWGTVALMLALVAGPWSLERLVRRLPLAVAIASLTFVSFVVGAGPYLEALTKGLVAQSGNAEGLGWVTGAFKLVDKYRLGFETTPAATNFAARRPSDEELSPEPASKTVTAQPEPASSAAPAPQAPPPAPPAPAAPVVVAAPSPSPTVAQTPPAPVVAAPTPEPPVASTTTPASAAPIVAAAAAPPPPAVEPPAALGDESPTVPAPPAAPVVVAASTPSSPEAERPTAVDDAPAAPDTAPEPVAVSAPAAPVVAAVAAPPPQEIEPPAVPAAAAPTPAAPVSPPAPVAPIVAGASPQPPAVQPPSTTRSALPVATPPAAPVSAPASPAPVVVAAAPPPQSQMSLAASLAGLFDYVPRLTVGLATFFVPMSLLQALSLVQFPGGRGLLFLTDLDTLFLDATMIASLVLLSLHWSTVRRHLPYVCCLLLLAGVSVALLSYVVINFGTLVRLRAMAVVPLWMAVLAAAQDRDCKGIPLESAAALRDVIQ